MTTETVTEQPPASAPPITAPMVYEYFAANPVVFASFKRFANAQLAAENMRLRGALNGKLEAEEDCGHEWHCVDAWPIGGFKWHLSVCLRCGAVKEVRP